MNKQYDQKKLHDKWSDLTGEHKFGDAGQLMIAVLFFTIWIIDTFIFKYSTFLNQIVSNAIRVPLGIILLVFSGFLAGKGLYIVFVERREKPGVIRKSIFKIVRHPIYLGEILLYLFFLMMSLSLAVMLVFFIAILFLHYISKHEERLLLERFGDEYKQYMLEVPMWIPNLWKK